MEGTLTRFLGRFIKAGICREAAYLNYMMEPKCTMMVVPENGFVWLEGEGFQGTCEAVAIDPWIRHPFREFDLLVYADGPSGSGRYWIIMVGMTKKDQAIPQRGFCFSTSTVGWRTLQEYKGLPLPWIGDRDGDGKPELIIWESFPLSEDASMAEYGLVAWVYQVDQSGKCKIDWDQSRKMAGEIAAAYRKPLQPSPSWPKSLPFSPRQSLRDTAAEALEIFATGKCTPQAQRLRQ